MDSLVHRKRFLLKNSCEQIRQPQLKIKEHQNSEESTQAINEMIANVKTLLYKTKNIKEDIEHTKKLQSVTSLQSKIEEYRKFQKTLLQKSLFSNVSLDQTMTGAFTMRLCREFSYWATVLVFAVDLIKEVDGVFCNQKQNNELNIQHIYFFIIKKINGQADEMIKASYDKMMECLSPQNQQQQQKKSEGDMVFDLISVLVQQRDKNLAKMKQMQENMNKMIIRVFRGLQIVSFEPIRVYNVEMSQDYNFSALLKKQMKRNKKLKKQLEQYSEAYIYYKKKRLNKLSSLAKIEPSTRSLMRHTNSIIKTSIKSLISIQDSGSRLETNKNMKLPILAPSRFDNQPRNTTSLSKNKRNRKEKMFSSSKSKQKAKFYQKKQNNLVTKQKKLTL